MKRKQKLMEVILVLVCAFVFPVFVSAMSCGEGGWNVKSYEVIVTNPNGIKLYMGDLLSERIEQQEIDEITLVVPYKTKLTVNRESYDSLPNEEYHLFGHNEYNGKKGKISLDDVELVDDKADLSNIYKLKEPQTVYIIDDTEMRKGPSEAYDKVEGDFSISKGTVITYEYTDNEDKEWAYVEYNGIIF